MNDPQHKITVSDDVIGTFVWTPSPAFSAKIFPDEAELAALAPEQRQVYEQIREIALHKVNMSILVHLSFMAQVLTLGPRRHAVSVIAPSLMLELDDMTRQAMLQINQAAGISQPPHS